MKTLIISGSTRRNGDTEFLVNMLQSKLNSDVKIISYFNNIAPCNDCRFCWTNNGCSIDDSMQEIYKYLEVCDNIVIASPIWFSSLSGSTLNIASRIQTIFSSIYFRKDKVTLKEKNGAIIIVGAEKGTEEIPTKTALTIMKFMNVKRSEVKKVYSLDTNNTPTKSDNATIEEIHKIAKWMNSYNEI